MAGDAGAQTAQGGEAQQQQQGDGPDVTAAIRDAMAPFAQGQSELLDFLRSGQQAGGEEAQQEGEPEIDLSWLDSLGEPGAQLDPQALQQGLMESLGPVIEQKAQQLVDQRIGPMSETLSNMERETHMERLVDEFPDMGDQEIAGQVVSTAHQLVQGNQWPQEVAQDPRFWRLIFMAGRGAETAQEEQEGGEESLPALLGGASGSGSGGGEQQHPGDAIVTARRGRGVLPFS